MFYKLIVYSNVNMSNKDKKLYIDKLFPSEVNYSRYTNRNIGIISKFNNSTGFKDVVSIEDNFGRITSPKVKSPKEYITPETLLYQGLFVSLKGNEVMSFTVEDTFIDHPVNYSPLNNL